MTSASPSGSDEAGSPKFPLMPWWGEFELPLRQARVWTIGPFRLRLWRADEEIKVTWWNEDYSLGDRVVVNEPAHELPPASATLERFGFGKAPERIQVTAVSADRPIVATPMHPFRLPPREELTVFTSVPVWLQLRSADHQVLLEQPLFRPSDTWFGLNTREGEVCYSNRTAVRLNLANLQSFPHRAACAVRVRNLASSVLDLERLKIPAMNLSLHAAEDARLWTESITLIRDADGDLADLRLGSTPAPEAGATTRVSGARQPPLRNTPLRAFGRMLRRGGFNA